MKLNTSEVAQKVRDQSGNPMLGDSVVRLVKQQRAGAAIDAYMEEKEPTLEALSDMLEYEMADMLQQHFDDESLDHANPVKANREILKMIARHAAIKFQKITAAKETT